MGFQSLTASVFECGRNAFKYQKENQSEHGAEHLQISSLMCTVWSCCTAPSLAPGEQEVGQQHRAWIKRGWRALARTGTTCGF